MVEHGACDLKSLFPEDEEEYYQDPKPGATYRADFIFFNSPRRIFVFDLFGRIVSTLPHALMLLNSSRKRRWDGSFIAIQYP